MAIPPAEHHNKLPENTERLEREPSFFEVGVMPWDGEENQEEYVYQERARFLGRAMSSIKISKGKLIRVDLADALQEHEVALQNVHRKQEVLVKARKILEDLHADFRKAHKEIERRLASFQGTDRDLLFEALDEEILGRKKVEPKENEPEEMGKARKKTLALFEKEIPEAEKEASRLAAYLFIKEERLDKAQSQLNGTREQILRREENLRVGERELLQVMSNYPGIAGLIHQIMKDSSSSDMQKAYDIHARLEEINEYADAGPELRYYFRAAYDFAEVPSLYRELLKQRREYEGLKEEFDDLQKGPPERILEQIEGPAPAKDAHGDE